MRWPFKARHTVGAILALVLIATACAWRFGLIMNSRSVPGNSILIIAPYRYEGTWVFDDPNVGLVREPFVSGVPEMIDHLVQDIPNADKGFRLLFSAAPFPGHQKKLTWSRGDAGGNYYTLDDPPMEGWLCPALFKYYTEPPQFLFVKAEALNR